MFCLDVWNMLMDLLPIESMIRLGRTCRGLQSLLLKHATYLDYMAITPRKRRAIFAEASLRQQKQYILRYFFGRCPAYYREVLTFLDCHCSLEERLQFCAQHNWIEWSQEKSPSVNLNDYLKDFEAGLTSAIHAPRFVKSFCKYGSVQQLQRLDTGYVTGIFAANVHKFIARDAWDCVDYIYDSCSESFRDVVCIASLYYGYAKRYAANCEEFLRLVKNSRYFATVKFEQYVADIIRGACKGGHADAVLYLMEAFVHGPWEERFSTVDVFHPLDDEDMNNGICVEWLFGNAAASGSFDLLERVYARYVQFKERDIVDNMLLLALVDYPTDEDWVADWILDRLSANANVHTYRNGILTQYTLSSLRKKKHYLKMLALCYRKRIHPTCMTATPLGTRTLLAYEQCHLTESTIKI